MSRLIFSWSGSFTGEPLHGWQQLLVGELPPAVSAWVRLAWGDWQPNAAARSQLLVKQPALLWFGCFALFFSLPYPSQRCNTGTFIEEVNSPMVSARMELPFAIAAPALLCFGVCD